MKWTESDLQKKLQSGTIQGYVIKGEKTKENKQQGTGRIVTKFFATRSREKNSILQTLLEFTQQRGLRLYEEYYFHPTRKWRFDHCIEELKIAIEYNGIMSKKSRHTTISGYSGDMNKLNAAQALEWRVIQLTPLNYTQLQNELNKYCELK